MKLPAIGIRAIIDGRRNGVREALEERSQSLAQLVADLISSTLQYRDGTAVRTVVSPGTIGGVREAVGCHRYFVSENVCAVLDISYAWAYAAEILVMERRWPKAIWGFNGSQRPGSVYLAGAIAAAEQKGLPIFKIYGRDVQDIDDISIPADVGSKILQFAQASIALAQMRGQSYLAIGSVSMGIGGSIVEPGLFQNYFDMRNEFVDMSELTRRLQYGIYNQKEFELAQQWCRANCQEMTDPNPAERQHSVQEKENDWQISIKMALIIRDLMVGNPHLSTLGYREEADGHQAIVAGFQGQRQWTDFMPNGDFAEAILNSTFDWNGRRPPYIVATENDSLNGLTMLMGHLLSNTAQIFADVRTYWSAAAINRITGQTPTGKLADGFIYLTNSGAAALDGSGASLNDEQQPCCKPFWLMSDDDVANCLKATLWGAGKLATFRGGGFSSSFRTIGGMPLTITRLNLVAGLGPVLQVVEGSSVDLDADWADTIVNRTDPTWPQTFFVPRLSGGCQSVYQVMESWGSNHCVISYGHLGHLWLTLASMLRIPVSLHNIAPERIFRPAVWRHFGSGDAADFAACRTYQALYR